MSTARITIVDYRAGNLASVQKALTHLGYSSTITDDPDAIGKAERILLPGVGHFSATQRLEDSGIKQAISEAVQKGIPFMGICVGLQWMFEGSTEAPEVRGLGLFKGMVERFKTDLKVPHVGWNTVQKRTDCRLLAGIPAEGFVYYTHSFRAPVVDGVIATTTYGEEFAAAVERDNVFGVQFHPEKSSDVGLKMLKNFCEANI